MWVKMTRLAYKATLKAVVMDDDIYDELQHDVKPAVGSNKLLIYSPYVAWKEAWRALYGISYGPRGGHRVYDRAGHLALKTIGREINYIDTHPALLGCAMFDIIHDIIPAWKVEPTDSYPKLYSPYPQPDHQFVILAPRWKDVRNQVKLTWWVEQTSAEGRIADEGLHLGLWRQPTR